MERDTPQDPIWVHTSGIEVTPEATRIESHVHFTEGTSEAELREAVGIVYGQDPSEIELTRPDTNNGQSSRRSFGFNNWGGAKWVPSGPQGNPENN